MRGVGSLVAFTLESPQARDRMVDALYAQKVLALRSGPRAIRFRLPLVISEAEVDVLLERVAAALPVAVGR